MLPRPHQEKPKEIAYVVYKLCKIYSHYLIVVIINLRIDETLFKMETFDINFEKSTTNLFIDSF